MFWKPNMYFILPVYVSLDQPDFQYVIATYDFWYHTGQPSPVLAYLSNLPSCYFSPNKDSVPVLCFSFLGIQNCFLLQGFLHM